MTGARVLFERAHVPGWRELGLRGRFVSVSGKEDVLSLSEMVVDRPAGLLTLTVPWGPEEARFLSKALSGVLSDMLARGCVYEVPLRLLFDEAFGILEEGVATALLEVGRTYKTQVVSFDAPVSRYSRQLEANSRWLGAITSGAVLVRDAGAVAKM
ncbi:hypothetical protein AS149_12450 [Burkholderia cenocepacia]|nr:hypothetical protein AS149_12450 [Burkholderia cenocepacia]